MTKDFAYVIEVRNLKIGQVAFITRVNQISHIRLESSCSFLHWSRKRQVRWSRRGHREDSHCEKNLTHLCWRRARYSQKSMRRNTENMEKQRLALGWHSAGRTPALQLKRNESYQWPDLSKSLLIRALPSNTLILTSWNSEQRNKYIIRPQFSDLQNCKVLNDCCFKFPYLG